MITEFLFLLCLGLCLGYEDEKKNEKLPKPSLRAWPSSVVERKSNVTLKCQSHFQNVTFMLGMLHDSRYKQEQNSAENKAEFPLTDLEPKDAGRYFCAYKTTASQEWSEKSEHLQLVVTGSLVEPSFSVNIDPEGTPGHRTLRCLISHDGIECIVIALLKTGIPEPLQVKKARKKQTDFILWNVTSSGNYSCLYYQCDFPYLGSFPSNNLEVWLTETRIISVTILSCLSIFLLFFSVFFIYRCTQHGSSHEESSKRRLQAEDPKGVTCTELNTNAPFEEASAPTEEPPGSCEYATLKV
ncbi:V-set and transmembrane domain-containing protein 1 [Cynocephalus volans]|uniref:V-set and transmembrane domain-containing protein 1 n=1 Tax=Cynocephalus volans TaxID=110931 RepID=UPI002FCA96E4